MPPAGRSTGRVRSNLPSRFLDELPQEEIHRERLRPSSWSGYGAPVARIQPRGDSPDLSTGDTVRHGTLGEGIVTAVEPGGVVGVRFAGEDTDRRLHAVELRAAGEDQDDALEIRTATADEFP